VPALLARSARSLDINVSTRGSVARPMDFLEELVASGAGTAPLQIGSERVLLADDAARAPSRAAENPSSQDRPLGSQV
jgi:hypothetical protein